MSIQERTETVVRFQYQCDNCDVMVEIGVPVDADQMHLGSSPRAAEYLPYGWRFLPFVPVSVPATGEDVVPGVEMEELLFHTQRCAQGYFHRSILSAWGRTVPERKPRRSRKTTGQEPLGLPTA